MNWRRKLHQHKRDLLTGFVIFVVGFAVFLCSPVRPISDSIYTFVVSESLLKHGSFAIDQFGVPRLEPRYNGSYMENGRITELEWVGNRLYYFLPPGTSVLSLPYVALMDSFGLSVINKDGTYNLRKEIQLQLIFSAFLMALLGSIFYFSSRLVLPALWSVIIALGGTLATQVWSTLSGSMWSDTWGIFLVGRSEEHTSELQSLTNLVCRLLLEKKKNSIYTEAVTGRRGLAITNIVMILDILRSVV